MKYTLRWFIAQKKLEALKALDGFCWAGENEEGVAMWEEIPLEYLEHRQREIIGNIIGILGFELLDANTSALAMERVLENNDFQIEDYFMEYLHEKAKLTATSASEALKGMLDEEMEECGEIEGVASNG